MNPVDVTKLTSGQWLNITWGFYWRGFLYAIVLMIAGGVAGGITGGLLGFMMGMARVDLETIRKVTGFIGGVLGLGLGIYSFRFYLKWILGARFGGMRLVLMSDTEPK